jgi:hypothetical protein
MCKSCQDTGIVIDWVDYGSTSVPMESYCECEYGDKRAERYICDGCGMNSPATEATFMPGNEGEDNSLLCEECIKALRQTTGA